MTESMAGTTSNNATTYPVTIRISDYGKLWPGMNVDAKIVTAENDNALSIPSAALERGNKVLITAASPSAANALPDKAPEGYVYVSVETGVSNDDYIEVTSGLQEGDKVAYLPFVSTSSAMGGNTTYALDTGVQVYLRKLNASNVMNYYQVSLSSINASDYKLTGWVDQFGCTAGGRVRIIIAEEK